MPELNTVRRMRGVTPRPRAHFLGLDFGLKRIGVAVGNAERRTAQALSTVAARDGVPNWRQLEKQVERWLPTLLVVGLPVNMNGSEGDIAKRARRFGREVGGRFGLDVVFVDERLSTRAADELLRTTATAGGKPRNPQRAASVPSAQKLAKKRDSVAAELIVLTYLADPNAHA